MGRFATISVLLLAAILGLWVVAPICGCLESSRAKTERARAQISVIAAAIQAYEADTGQFPPTLLSLLNPSPYLPQIPVDPFAASNQPISYSRADGACQLYSLGPDGFDDRGLLVYDPTNGAESDGDILLTCPQRDSAQWH
jgi:type II secretory pathway pseudopilin PulG